MKKMVFALAIFAGIMFYAISNVFAPIVNVPSKETKKESSSSTSVDSSTVDLRDKAANKPVKLLR